MLYELRMRFFLSSKTPNTIDFSEIQNVLKLGSPDSTWRIGDRLDNRSKRVFSDEGIGFLISEKPDADPIAEIEALLKHFDAIGVDAKNLLAKFSSQIAIVIELYGRGSPNLHLRPELLTSLGDHNIEIDIDLYSFAHKSKK